MASAARRAASNAAGDLRSRVDGILTVSISDQAIVDWWGSPQPELDGATPAEWVAGGKDPAVVVDAARHTAGVLKH